MTDLGSVFSYDGEGEPDVFNLIELTSAVSQYFGSSCRLEKLAQGGYHKVYDVLDAHGEYLEAIVRVAAPAMPKDKLESEIATMQYISSKTSVPVPRVLAWNSDATGPVGAEYMIIQKIPGGSASDVWDTLPLSTKKVVVEQVAEYLFDLFRLRFEKAGSLYSTPHQPSTTSEAIVGPIVSAPFFRAVDGVVRVPDANYYAEGLKHLRGPFTSTTQYLSFPVEAELHLMSHHKDIALSEGSEKDLVRGDRVLRKVLTLCSLYPGDARIPQSLTTPDTPYSLLLDDFRLSNIMIDQSTGKITGLIDFEGATVAPLWLCSTLPRWLIHPDDHESSYEGGPAEERAVLASIFHQVMNTLDPVGEWQAGFKEGRPFRRLVERLQLRFDVWASDEDWVDGRLAWAEVHPAEGFPEDTIPTTLTSS